VLIVEATPRNGSLSTAGHTVEENREIFAMPGAADSLLSRGCNRLIRDDARLVETVADILEELGPLVHEVRTDPEEPPVRHPAELARSDSERSLLGQFDDQQTGADDLIARTGMTVSPGPMATLSFLELKRLVCRLPGHRFARVCGRAKR
jgi:DNA processing protein